MTDENASWDRSKPITSKNHPPCDYCDLGCNLTPCTCMDWGDKDTIDSELDYRIKTGRTDIND